MMRAMPRRISARALVVVLLTAVVTGWILPPTSMLAQDMSTRRQIYWGAHIDGHAYGFGNPPWDMRAVSTFEAAAGKQASILTLGSYWAIDGKFQPFDAKAFNAIRDHGAIPFFTWSSADSGKGTDQPDFRNREIAAGRYDDHLRTWARAARAWGHPFFLRLDGEMDGWWHPWGEGKTAEGGPIVNGNAPGDFVLMWRHVHDIFAEEQVQNVTWVWCIGQLSTSSQYPSLAQVYPGDDVVDWSGMDPYNKYRTWLTFSQALDGDGVPWLKNTYQEILTVAPEKPMMLGEVGSVEKADDSSAKATWLRSALLDELPNRFSRIQAIIYFNWALNHRTVSIESSQPAQSAFAEGIASDYYANNAFGSLCTSPIPPLASFL